jgi:hypothetical protein
MKLPHTYVKRNKSKHRISYNIKQLKNAHYYKLFRSLLGGRCKSIIFDNYEKSSCFLIKVVRLTVAFFQTIK